MTFSNKFRLSSAKTWRAITSAIIILIGFGVLLGWLFNISFLKSVLPGLANMKANTALSFLLIGIALWLLSDERVVPSRRRVAQLCALTVFLIGLLTLAEYLFALNLGIDQWLFTSGGASAGLFPGRMAAATAFSLVLLGLALWLTSRNQSPTLAQCFALLVAVVGLFAFAGYLYDVRELYNFSLFSAIALHTSFALFLSGLTLLFLRPERGFVIVITARSSGGLMARRLLPAVIIAPLVLGWLRLKGQEAGLYGTSFGLTLFALANIVLFTPLIWWNAHLLNKTDAERKGSAAQIRKLNRTLAVLSDINQTIVRVRHMPSLYERVCEIAVQTGEFRMIWIGLIDPVTQTLTLTAHAGVSDAYVDGLKLTLSDKARSQGLVTGLSRAANHIVFNDFQAYPNITPEQRETAALLDYRSLALLPLFVAGELRGVISLCAKERDFFDDEELKLLDEMAGDVAFAMEFAEQEAQRQQAQTAVLESEGRYHRALDSLLEGAEIIGFDWHYLYVNDASASHGRQPKEVLLRSTVIELYPGIENTEMFATLRTCMEERTAQHFETEFVFPDGTKSWFDLSVQPIPEGIFILSLDITQRKNTEQALSRYAERMEMLHAIDTGIIQGEATQGLVEVTIKHLRRVIPCQRTDVIILDEPTNEALIYAVGIDSETTLGQGVRVPIPPDVFEGYDARHMRVFDDIRLFQETMPRAKRLVNEGLVSALSVLLMNQDRPIGVLGLFSDTPGYFTTKDQEIVGEVANQLAIAIRHLQLNEEIIQYTTELEQNVSTIGEMRQFLQTTLDVLSAGIAVLDPDGTVINVNDAWERFSTQNGGLSESAYLNSNYLTICDTAVGPLSTEAVPAAAGIRAVISGQQADFYLEYPCDSPSQKRWFGMRVTPFIAPPPHRVVVAHTDITLRKLAEEALREVNETLEQRVLDRTLELNHAKESVEAILNNSMDGILLTDANLHIQQTNAAFNLLFADEPDEHFDGNLLDFIHAQDANRIVEIIRSVIAERKGSHAELRCVRANGVTFDAEFSLGYFAEEEGLEGIVCIIQDISERKRNEAILRESEGKFRSLVEAAPIATVITDKAGVITLVNEQSELLFGYTATELIGLPVEVLVPKSIHDQHVHHRLDYVSAPRVRAMGEGMELFAQRKDGSEFPVQIELSYVETELGLLVITFIVDITERKERERQLVFNASLQEAVTDAVIATDLEFRIQSWNPAAERIYGWSTWEVIGKLSSEVLKTEFVSGESRERIARDFMEKGFWTDEVLQYHRDGHAINILGSAVLFKDQDGHSIGVVTVNHDISERKKTEFALHTKVEDEREFQGYLKSLHEITIELAQIDQLDDFYKYVVQQGLERLGIERLGLLLYDAEHSLVIGTYGTDAQGNLMAEHHIHFDPKTLTGILTRSLERSERFAFDENVQLFSNLEPIGFGWNAAAVLWNGEQNLGWLAADNAVHHTPASKPLLDILSLYALTIGTLLARKKTEVTLRESEARYRILANTINDVVMRFTPAFEYVYVSPSSRSVLGYEPEELLGHSDFRRIHPDDVAPIQELVKRLVEHPGGSSLTYRFRHKQGHYIWLENTGQAIVSEQTGEVFEFVFSARDVTERIVAQEAVRESEARYRLLADNINDMITRIDTSGMYVYVSPSSRVILGYEPEELVGKSGFELIHPNDVAEVISRQSGALDPNAPTTPLTYRVRCKDGHYIWVETNGQIIWSADKTELLGFITVSRDITERKRADEALALSEQRYTLLVNGVSDYAIYVLDPEGHIVSWNPGAESIKGYTANEILGQHFSRFYTPEDIAQGQPQAVLTIAEHQRHYVGEGWRVRKNGSRFWAEVVVTALRDSEDNLIGFTKITRDLTERKRIENALLEQRDFLQLVVDNVPGLIIVKDLEGRFQLVNNMIAKVYGVTPADMIGKTDADFNPNLEEVEFFAEKDRETLSSGQSVFIPEETLLNRYYQTSKIPLQQSAGSFDRLLVVASDITERKEAEEVLRRALNQEKELGELKSRFVSMASHEFRTPLATILAAAETLSAYRQRMTESQIDHRINNIRDQVDHLKNIIEDVLQLARIQAGRLEFNPVLLNLDGLCRSVIDEFQSHPDVVHQLIYSCDAALMEIKLDKKLMRQIINNLVSNAIKYSPNANKIFINLEYMDESVVLSVRDEGIGIPESDLKHLFEPFHRATNVGTISGTGLGLSITKEAVELHGGTIEVDSRVGDGTRVVITIPASKRTDKVEEENPGS